MGSVNNTERFYEVIWPHRAVVLRTATYLTSRSADAEDLAQETLLKAFKAMDGLQPGTNTKAWLLTILRHAHIDNVRAKSHKETSLEQLEYDPAESVAWQPCEATDVWKDPESALNELSDQQVIDALGELPKEIRWTLLLTDVEGLDAVDASAILDVPVGTIKSRLHRGRRMLRQKLAPHAREMRMPVSDGVKALASPVLSPTF